MKKTHWFDEPNFIEEALEVLGEKITEDFYKRDYRYVGNDTMVLHC